MLNKHKYLFPKMENRKVKQFLPRGGGWYQWEDKGKGEEGEYVDILCTHV
jgi:hypothetical protein